VTAAEHCPVAAGCVMLAGQVIAGGVVSLTVTVNVHCVLLLKASVAAQVTVVTPLLKVVPEAGLQTTVAPAQLSEATGVANVITAVHKPLSVDWVMGKGQLSVGGVVSLTVTVNVHEVVLLMPSVAVQVTSVTPFGNAYPGAGAQTVFTVVQLSVAVGGM